VQLTQLTLNDKNTELRCSLGPVWRSIPHRPHVLPVAVDLPGAEPVVLAVLVNGRGLTITEPVRVVEMRIAKYRVA
jgi:hypothetical protein